MADMSADKLAGQRPSEPIVGPGYDYASVTDKISGIVLTRRTPKWWILGFAAAFVLVMLLLFAITYLFALGVGIWGVQIPSAWGFAIVNFVWWIGIGHAGTLISAILLLLHQQWRTSINRFAEAMTLFAVACAGLFPLIHMGRPWVFYWVFPYPDTMKMWPNFRSPLIWDVFAISTYGTVSLLFWFVGLLPDLATMRDRVKNRAGKIIYGILAMGWRGSATHWYQHETACLLLAGLATPLVVSVHTVVSFDFSYGLVPGWHSTIFPPYFVAGAIFQGFAMVLTLLIPLRKLMGLEDFITLRHLDIMGKVMLATGVIVGYGYVMETFESFYSANKYDIFMIMNRMGGPYAAFYWCLIAFNVVATQFLWSRRVRTSGVALFAVAMCINVGMWLERFMIIPISLHRDFMPSAWGMYYPTRWDYATLFGSVGLFLALIFLFIRFLPLISIFEMRELVGRGREKRAAS
jgi:molybdopterin-containing oxidoreductase family membrane subunit